MGLKRVWTPTGSYSGGSRKRLIVIHTMEGFTGSNGAKDCAIYFQGDVGASSQVCIDNNRGTIWECVSRGNSSWTQCNYNSVSVSAEQSGYASWSKDYWLANRSNQLHNMSDWIAEESKQLGIPVILLSDSQAQTGSAGVTFHSRLGSAGCGHSDPGSGYPINEVLGWAIGGTIPGGIDVGAGLVRWNGNTYRTMIGTDHRIYYKGPDTDGQWHAIPDSNARSLGSLAVEENGTLFQGYINEAGNYCTYERKSGGGNWYWSSQGGQSALSCQTPRG